MSTAPRRLLAALGASAVLVAAGIAVSASGGAKPAARPPSRRAPLFRGIPEHDGVLGDPRAPLTLTEYVDLQCPICAEASKQTLPWLVENYVRTGKAKLELRTLHFIGPDSERAARVAAGAERQGRLWPFVEAFYAAQGGENSGYVTDGFLRSVAKAAGVDAGKALAAADGEFALRGSSAADADATRLGVNSTPTFTVAKGRPMTTVGRASGGRRRRRPALRGGPPAVDRGRARRPRHRGLPDGRALRRRRAGVRDRPRLRDRAEVGLRRPRRRAGRPARAARLRAILGSLAGDGERARMLTAVLAFSGFGLSAWLTWIEVGRAARDLHLVRRLGPLHDRAGRALGGAARVKGCLACSSSKQRVVGAGVMGGEIAQVIASADIPVLLKDVKQEFVDKGLEKAREVTESQAGKLVKREKLTQEQADAQIEHTLGLITGTTEYDDFGDVDFVIEAVPEKMAIKHQVFADLDAATPGHAILASNTSGLSITEIGDITNRPDKVVGFHFFWPASNMRLIEVIEGEETSPETAQAAANFAQAIRKMPVRCAECPGFVVNRILASTASEIWRYQDETGTNIEDIDKALTESKLVPMGPFFLADMSGLDTALKVARDMRDAYGDRFYVHQGMEELVEQGNLGQKSGKGFYEHS